ncbi:uncharacterized protein N7496_010943 [Penicillium cataractarum]|uniref:Uncharacterized protein n=1 Tax=Penicillium cataractarum TaxID=2100454 RepID=A0A9W9RFB2_9EURO|nr:uncharacterized protein N7496_010943 [Penicillium cataractarum]KAJ5358530.1 hypothetical protein N7496_010943 [Penicillium cataractarum]
MSLRSPHRSLMGFPGRFLLSGVVCRQITRRTAIHAPSLQRPLLGRAWRTGIHAQSRVDAIALPQRARGIHLACNTEEEQKYRELRLGAEFRDVESAFQTLLVFVKSPEIAGQLRHLEVHGSSDVHFDRDRAPDFSILPQEPRQLDIDDLESLKMAIEKAGFMEGNEAQMVLHILLQNPDGRYTYVIPHLPFVSLAGQSVIYLIRSTRYSDNRFAGMAFKQAVAALLITTAPNLESLSVCPIGEYHRYIKGYSLLSLFRRANTARGTLPYLQNLKKILFLPAQGSMGNNGFHYNTCENYHERLNLVRRLPVLESVSFVIAEWNNEAGNPPPPNSANYSDIRVTRSNLGESDFCFMIDSSKALRKFTWTIGGRAGSEGLAITELSPLVRSLWKHRYTLEELDIDIEDNMSAREIYGMYGVKRHEELYEDEDLVYDEAWEGEMAELDTSLETVPVDICLMDFPKLKRLGLGVHSLCFLARGIGPNRLGAESLSLVDRLPGSLESLRLYGKGEESNPVLNFGHQSDLDVDALLETLVAEKDEKLPALKTIEGFDPVIPRAKEVPDYAYPDDDHPLIWKQPEHWLG